MRREGSGYVLLRTRAVFLVFFTFVACVLVLGCSASSDKDRAVSTVDSAELAMGSAYDAVLEAEEAGANVSGLLVRLNAAAEYLAAANMCLRVRDFDGAFGNASFCVEALDGILYDAEVLRDRAIRERSQRSLMTISGSILCVVVVVCGCWLGWSFFKKRYYERVLEMRPEVVEGES